VLDASKKPNGQQRGGRGSRLLESDLRSLLGRFGSSVCSLIICLPSDSSIYLSRWDSTRRLRTSWTSLSSSCPPLKRREMRTNNPSFTDGFINYRCSSRSLFPTWFHGSQTRSAQTNWISSTRSPRGLTSSPRFSPTPHSTIQHINSLLDTGDV